MNPPRRRRAVAGQWRDAELLAMRGCRPACAIEPDRPAVAAKPARAAFGRCRIRIGVYSRPDVGSRETKAVAPGGGIARHGVHAARLRLFDGGGCVPQAPRVANARDHGDGRSRVLDTRRRGASGTIADGPPARHSAGDLRGPHSRRLRSSLAEAGGVSSAGPAAISPHGPRRLRSSRLTTLRDDPFPNP